MKRLLLFLIGGTMVYAQEAIIWQSLEKQSLEFSFPHSEQKQLHGDAMRVWSAVFWASKDEQHRRFFMNSSKNFARSVLDLNSTFDRFLFKCKETIMECQECVDSVREDIRYVSDIISKVVRMCTIIMQSSQDPFLSHAFYIFSVILEKSDVFTEQLVSVIPKQ